MMSNEYLPMILIAAVVAVILLFLLLRPKQQVRLGNDTPVRPHMASSRDSSKEANDLASEAAAAASDVTGEIIKAPVHDHLVTGDQPGDDLQRIKGVGPKLAEILRGRGYSSFAQLARLTPQEIAMLDEQLGAFRGRIERDRIVEQAQYLERGDTEGFERQFGKL